VCKAVQLKHKGKGRGRKIIMSSLNSLYEGMNTFLADQLVLSMKIHNVHWNIKGGKFFTLHPMMDQYYDEHMERIDEVAERLLAIGGQPIGSLRGALEITTLKEREDKKVFGKELVETLTVDFAQVRNHAKRLVEIAEEVDDCGTADYFTAVIQAYDKELWMLNSYLEEE
jgi:DNA-binding ferritin-like protein (oxidative damage protectant)